MNTIQKLGAVALMLCAFSMPAHAADDAKKAEAPKAAASPEFAERGWSKRCVETKDGTKGCEIYDFIGVKGASTRVAEFAIGFPQDKSLKKGDARGVVILPLGILLEPGVAMKIDDGKPAVFKSRYCDGAGCYSFITVSKDMLESMKKAKAVHFFFKGAQGQDVNLIMNLAGLGEALKSLEG